MPEVRPLDPKVELEKIDFTEMKQHDQVRVVSFLGIVDWQAFMFASKYTLELAFHHEYLCGIVLSVLLKNQLLTALSLESFLSRFRASPAFGGLVLKIKETPTSLDAGDWAVYINSLTSVDQLKAIPFNIGRKELMEAFLGQREELDLATESLELQAQLVHQLKEQILKIPEREKVKLEVLQKEKIATEIITEFLSATYNLLAFHDSVDNEGAAQSINSCLLGTRARECAELNVDVLKISELITTLRSLPHDERFTEAFDMMLLELVRVNIGENFVRVHDHRMSRISLLSVSLPGVNLQQVDLSLANLQHVNFKGGTALYMSCPRANAQHANFSEMILGNSNFESTDLRWASFENAFMMYSNLSGANLSYASMRGAYLGVAILENAVIFDADLQGANLTMTRLSQANLSKCNLQKARFVGSFMQQTVLHAADMQEAIFSVADLSHSDCTGANFSRAQIMSADFTGAILVGVNFKDATIDKITLTDAIVLGVTQPHLDDVELFRARLDIVFEAMRNGEIPKKLHHDYRINAARELVKCMDLYQGLSAQQKIHYLEAVIQHPIFSAQHLGKTKRALNHAIGLFSEKKIAVKSESQKMIAECMARLHEGAVNRPRSLSND